MVHRDVARDFPDYLRDESRMVGEAASISFPETVEEAAETLAQMHAHRIPVTIQGARTGITGGAVPQGGHVLNLSRMRRVLGLRRGEGCYTVQVEPGVVLSELTDRLHAGTFETAGWDAESLEALRMLAEDREHFLPPDPTESTASLGGMISCNASGSRTYAYGATREYVQALTVLLADGATVRLERGRDRARGRSFQIAGHTGLVPSYRMPQVKNASGYFAREDMDLVDLFVGAEGTLGVVVAADLRLVPFPASVWGVTAFLPSPQAALGFVHAARELPAEARPVAIEYFDANALELLHLHSQIELPGAPEPGRSAVYVEYHGESEEEVTGKIMAMTEALQECGGNEEETWIASGAAELGRLRDFRHAVPESVNRLIDERRRTDPSITKLGTDMAVPDECLEAVFAMYRRDLERLELEHAIFGHIGNNHVHVNILPADGGQYERGKELYAVWAEEVIRMGGTISAEHGVGKLKRELLLRMYGPAGIEEMRAVKRSLDPSGILNPGNLF